MPKIPKLISKYNFYPDLHETLSPTALADKGVLGYAGDDPGYPNGKPIYKGIENNSHLNFREHFAAQKAVQKRIEKMDSMLNSGLVAPQDLDAVKAERAAMLAQASQHGEQHRRLQETPSAPPTGRLRTLRKAMRGK